MQQGRGSPGLRGWLSEGDSRRALAFGTVGLLQGGAFVLAHELWPEGGGPEVARVLTPAFAAGVAGLCIQFTWSEGARGRMAATALVTAGIFAAIAGWVFSQLPPHDAPYRGDDQRAGMFWCCATIALYALGPHLQVFVASGRARGPYAQLFFHAWNNALVALFGFAYAAVFSVLALLCRGLFEVLGVTVVKEVVDSPRFWLSCLPVLFGFGVATGSANVRLLDSLRATLLAVFRFLMPVVAGISLAFLFALPFTGLEPIWRTGYASYLLLSTVVVGALFANAVLEDGGRALGYPALLRLLMAAELLALPVFAGLALYSLGLRIAQYGLVPERIFGVVAATILGLYGIAYAIAVSWPRRSWIATFGSANVALSWVVILVALALHTPAFDPIRLSVASQLGRLASGRSDPTRFDYASLRFSLGQRGYAALQALAKDARAEVQAGARTALAAKGRYELEHGAVVLSLESVEPVGGLASAPDGLLEAAAGSVSECARERRCPVFEVELAGAPGLYCLVLSARWSGTRCFQKGAAGWQHVGDLEPAELQNDCGHRCDVGALVRRSPPRAVPAPFPDVEIDSQRFRLRRR